MDKSKQVSAIGTCLKIFQAEGEYTTEMRRAVMEKVCLPMFRLCQVDSVIEVFQRNIRDFVDILENKLKKVSNYKKTKKFWAICVHKFARHGSWNREYLENI